MRSKDILIFEMLAKERRIPEHQLQPYSRLVHDLGMDGDDAVDFFASLSDRFGTDFSSLESSWSDHFSPESHYTWRAMAVWPAAIIGGAIAGLKELGLLGGIGITILLLFLWYLAMRRRGPIRGLTAVTVGEIIAAVDAGAWRRPDHRLAEIN